MSAPLCTAYGAILIDRAHIQAAAFIKSLGDDKTYPYLDASMFSPSEYDKHIKYDQMIIGYAATYSANIMLGYIPTFILKFEHILRNIDFETAVVHINGSYYGQCHLGWVNKQNASNPVKDGFQEHDFRLIETKEWYFGFGIRELGLGMLEFPESDDDKFHLKTYGYPVQFNKQAVEIFNNRIEQLLVNESGVEVSIWEDLVKIKGAQFDEVIAGMHTLLIGLELQGIIEYGSIDDAYKFKLRKKLNPI